MDLENVIPASVAKEGIYPALCYVHHGTSVGVFLRSPEVRSLLAEDLVLSEAQTIVDAPCFLEREEEWVEEWLKERGPFAKDLAEVALAPLAAFRELPAEIWERRRLLRLAAVRHLDLVSNGRQNFMPCAELAGDPYVAVVVPDYPDTIPVGRVGGVSYDIDARRDPEVREFVLHPGRIEALEAVIEPLFSAVGGPKGWAHVVQLRKMLAPVVEWERKNGLPALLRNVVADIQAPPPGATLRTQVAKITEEMGNYGALPVLAWLGISCFVLDAYKPFLAAQAERLRLLEGDPCLTLNFTMSNPAIAAAVGPVVRKHAK